MKKILHIEDEPEEVLLVKEYLEKGGYEFISAKDGEEGLKKAREEKPDLIFLDIFLPKVNGFEVCRQLRQSPETKNIPIVVITGSGVEYIEDQCKNAGADGCIIKPFELSGLVAKIKKVLGEKK